MDWTKIKHHIDNELNFMDKSGGIEFKLRQLYGSPELILVLDRVVDLENKLRKDEMKKIIKTIRSQE